MGRRFRRWTIGALAAAAGLPLALWLAGMVLDLRIKTDSSLPLVPMAVLSRSACDLGMVSQGDVLRIRFPIANEGTRRLIVTELGAACCGTTAADRQIVLAPGESKELVVAVETERYFGRLEHTARYLTNDPRLPRFTLKVTGDVRPAA